MFLFSHSINWPNFIVWLTLLHEILNNTCIHDGVLYCLLKSVRAIFYQFFIFYQMIALQKLWKMFFISSKKLFSFSRYSIFYVFVFPSFFSVSHCFRGWSEKKLKVYDVINCLNNNLMTHFVWYIEKEMRCDIKLCLLIEY